MHNVNLCPVAMKHQEDVIGIDEGELILNDGNTYCKGYNFPRTIELCAVKHEYPESRLHLLPCQYILADPT